MYMHKDAMYGNRKGGDVCHAITEVESVSSVQESLEETGCSPSPLQPTPLPKQRNMHGDRLTHLSRKCKQKKEP